MFTDEDWETINTLCSVWQTSLEAPTNITQSFGGGGDGHRTGPPLVVKWPVHCTLDGVQFSSWKTRFQTYTRKTKVSQKNCPKNPKFCPWKPHWPYWSFLHFARPLTKCKHEQRNDVPRGKTSHCGYDHSYLIVI